MGNIDSNSQPSTSSTLPYRSSPATPASRGTPAETLAAPSPSSGNTSKILTPKLEYEGESSLSAQAAFANKFLRDAVSSKPSADVTGEMASVLDTLSRTIGNQKREQEPEYLYPHARTLEPGTTLRDLPMPPVETAFTCLRMAKGIEPTDRTLASRCVLIAVQNTLASSSFGITKQTPSHRSPTTSSRFTPQGR